MSKKFQRKIENFTCEHCGKEVIGDGFTNHCPNCLWSKHVDINPGDREATCQGMMQPVRIEGTTPKYMITHVCAKCGIEKRNRVEERDNFDEVLKIAKKRK